MHHYAFHIGDYAAHTGHLDPLEDLAYRRAIDAYMLSEGPLPADKAEVARRIRMRDHIDVVSAVLEEFFTLTEDGWRNARCDAEIEKVQCKSSKARSSAAKRWHSSSDASAEQPHSEGNANAEPTQCDDDANAMRTHSERNATQDPIPNTHINRPSSAARKTRLPEGFAISDRVRTWAAEQKFGDLARHLEHFVGYCRANGKAYVDWDQAFMNAIRADWAGLRKAGPRLNGTVIAHPSSATPDDAVMRRISDANGGMAVVRLPDGRLQCGVAYYRPNGQQEVAI